GDSSVVKLDILTEDFSDDYEMIFKPNRLVVLGSESILVPPDTIQMPDGMKIQNAEHYNYASTLIESAFSPGAVQIFGTNLVRSKTLKYQLEERKGSLSVGFSFLKAE
ncbi:MAG: hypothetical protein HQK83_07460, partial [Fibrobacteria bacterium]|nr:hypothetical protein [Fibrobacteria bacterium]